MILSQGDEPMIFSL